MHLTEGNVLEPYLGELTITRRQDKEAVYARNGAAVYITRIDRIKDFVFGGRLLPYEMPFEDSIDIDDEDDWRRVEARLNAQ